MAFKLVNDAETAISTFLQIERTANTCDSVAFTTTALSTTGTLSVTGTSTFSGIINRPHAANGGTANLLNASITGTSASVIISTDNNNSLSWDMLRSDGASVLAINGHANTVGVGGTLAVTGATALGAQATLTPTDAAAFTGYGINYGGGLVAGVDIKPNTGEVRMGGFSTSDYYPVIYSDGVAALSFGLGGAPTATFAGAVSKASGSFKIDHPLPAKKDTHHLVHSFVEGPRADLIYRGVAALSGGSASVDLDAAADMTSGTWELLCRDPQVWIQNDSGWAQVRGSVAGSTLTIACEDAASTDSVSWMVVAERCDPHIIETDWTDAEGRVIVEPEKVVAAEAEAAAVAASAAGSGG